MGHSLLSRLCVVGLLALAGAGGAVAACARWWPLLLDGDPRRALPGVRLDGESLDGEIVSAVVASRAGALVGRRVRLVVREGDEARTVIESTLADLGVTVDGDAVSARILRLGRTEDAFARARLADRARRGEIEVRLRPAVDARSLVERLVPLKESLDVAPVPARLDLERHDVVAERPGRSLDVDGAVVALERAAMDPAALEVQLPFAEVAPHVTRASLARVDITHVLASFETYFSRGGDQGPRARNIEVAASHLEGMVIDPGQSISFNDAVGARSEENGFKRAFEIFKGEMVEGTGGGTCQVASTLHATAFFGGLDILERLPHSRPSAYIPAGLDATVVYPVVDLKLRNPFPFPVVLHTRVAGNKLRMELLGADKPVEVTFGRDVLSTTPFGRKVVEEPGLEKPKRKQKGIEGMELWRVRVIARRDGTRKVEGSRDTYPPTQEIWLVPVGYDESQLPPLGEDIPKPDDARPKPVAEASGI